MKYLLNPLNAQLNLIRPLLALFGAHHILHVSRIRAKCLMNTMWWSYSIASCWRNTGILVHLNAFLCDCTLVSFGQLAKTFYIPPHYYSPWWGHSNYWNVLLTGTYDFFGLNFYTANLGRDGVEGGIPSRGRDTGAILSQDPSWPESASSWLRVRTSSHLLIYFFSLNLIFFH